MTKFLFCLIAMITVQASAQNSDYSEIKQTIEDFFEGFHAQDSLKIVKTVHADIMMQSIDSQRGSEVNLETLKFEDFLNSILSIPETVSFNEKILDYEIKVDGEMAHAWTPYEFYLNAKLSHTGVNSFQLFKDVDDWKIIYVVDTRK